MLRTILCHCGEAKRLKNLAQGKLREESRPFSFAWLKVRVTVKQFSIALLALVKNS
jgi:hypothetical protein